MGCSVLTLNGKPLTAPPSQRKEIERQHEIVTSACTLDCDFFFFQKIYQEFSEKVKAVHFVLAPGLSKYFGFNTTLVFNVPL